MFFPIYATSTALSIALLGTGAVHAPASAVHQATHETILYSFGSGSDGANPFATLLAGPGGGLFGTTVNGGPAGAGTTFSVKSGKRGWVETVQYAFHGSDGAHPFGSLADNGRSSEVGTTADGGAYGYGVVFEITPAAPGKNVERVLWSFQGGSLDGANPYAGVIVDTRGDLFGTTLNGGSSGAGTVFELSPNRQGYSERILWNFKGGNDGAFPYAELITDTSGALYGTTHAGGRSDYGTVFKLTPSGTGYTEGVLYAFQGGDDGANPYGELELGPSGPLYGTTQYGGPSDDGTVYELKPSGSSYSESLNWSFDRHNGYVPNAAVIRTGARSGASTTAQGGSDGDGLVFQLSPTASGGTQETVLHLFSGSPDGALPYGGLIEDSSRNLYGATYEGGAHGYGTVYELTP